MGAARTAMLARLRADVAHEAETTAVMERAITAFDRVSAELRTERRLRQRAQSDVLNLLSLLSGLPLGALVDAGLTTADLALIDRIEERWTKEND